MQNLNIQLFLAQRVEWSRTIPARGIYRYIYTHTSAAAGGKPAGATNLRNKDRDTRTYKWFPGGNTSVSERDRYVGSREDTCQWSGEEAPLFLR
jgi:hypothetical protein